MEHSELGIQRVNLARDELEGVSTADMDARRVGRQVTMVLSPLPEGKRRLKYNESDADFDADDEGDASEEDATQEDNVIQEDV
jgi:hypothetical protein